jgi:hypothetical protein
MWVVMSQWGGSAKCVVFVSVWIIRSRSQRPSVLRRGSAAARLLGLRVRIPPGAWMFVRCECRVNCQVEVSAMS